jgi:23S rRNA pseudouridine2605 synthase
MEERLQKVMARAGLGSRRACEELIAQGRVTVNGQPALLGQKADPARDQILLDGEPVARPEKLTYAMLYKPRGVVSSLAAQGERLTVRDLVNLEVRLYPVGRLDVDSEGLILLTNDGELADYLTHPRYESEKEYRVLVKGDPDAERLQAWSRGVVLEGQRTAPAQVVRQERAANGTWLRIVMHEGRKHQIRDIGLLLGLPVQRLIRIRMGALRLGNLQPGEWRTLKADEVAKLRETGEAGPPPRSADPRNRGQKSGRKEGIPGPGRGPVRPTKASRKPARKTVAPPSRARATRPK